MNALKRAYKFATITGTETIVDVDEWERSEETLKRIRKNAGRIAAQMNAPREKTLDNSRGYGSSNIWPLARAAYAEALALEAEDARLLAEDD